MKQIKCKVRLQGGGEEIMTGEFESIASAKKWIAECWKKHYTIEKTKGEQTNAPLMMKNKINQLNTKNQLQI